MEKTLEQLEDRYGKADIVTVNNSEVRHEADSEFFHRIANFVKNGVTVYRLFYTRDDSFLYYALSKNGSLVYLGAYYLEDMP